MNIVFFSHIAKSDEERSLYKISRVLSLFQSVNRSMSAEVANVFLMVCLNEDQRLADYAKMTGLAQSTLSRYLLDLSTYRRDQSAGASEEARKEAYGLIRSEVDPLELRSKRYSLTARGRALRDKIMAILSDTEEKGPTQSVVALVGGKGSR